MVTKQSPLLLGRYRLGETMAEGGMGTVVLARDEVLGRRVAVKLMKDSLAGDGRAVERFRREARIAASLSHPGIAHVFDFGEQDGRPFIVMEFLEGEDLQSVVRREGRLDPAEAAAIAANVADALEHAHKAGAIHRDVKPGNIFLTQAGEVKLTDFGIAQTETDPSLTQAGIVMGTFYYLSPEQINGEPATPSSDIYSLGCVLFQMLTGDPPFEGESPAAVGLAHVTQPVPQAREVNPDIPASIDQIVTKAMAKSPLQRFGSASEMASALRTAIAEADTVPAAIRRPSPPRGAEESEGERTQAVAGAPATRTLTAVHPAIPETPVPVRRDRLRKPAVAALAAGILLLLLLLGPAQLGLGSVTVPEWTGAPIDEAMEQARQLGLNPERVDDPSELPVGQVTRQEPVAGTEVRRGSTVRLFASLGYKRVPNLIGTSLENALRQLAELGLQAEVVGEQGANAVVVEQNPPPDSVVEPDTTVTLTARVPREDRPGPPPGRGRGGGDDD